MLDSHQLPVVSPRRSPGRLLAVAVAALALSAGLGGPGLDNLHEVIPGRVYRSGQPTRAALEHHIRRLRLGSILNLRGANPRAQWYREEIDVASSKGVLHLDLPLGSPRPREPFTVMANVLGGDYPELYPAYRHVMARDPGIKVHLYGKDVRPGRKIGHVNLLGSSTAEVDSVRCRATAVAGIIRDGRVTTDDSSAIFEENA